MTLRPPLPPINFKALADALLARAETLVPNWLPGGHRNGHEWVCAGLSGGAGTSCSVNLTTGKWADFASDEKGGDLVGLYAAIHGLDMGKAAVEVARDYGLEDVAGVQPDPKHEAKPQPVAPPPSAKPKPRESEGWTALTPVPDYAPTPTYWHPHRKAEDIEHLAHYAVDGATYGYVVRFRTSDGGKDTLPYTFCQSARDGTSKWHWKQWDEPRPLYFPAGITPGVKTVILVEGEKKAGILQALLDQTAPGVYCVASWAGGCKAWDKAAWAWLQGCTVILWPDCDAKREALNKQERDSVKDNDAARLVLEQAKPLLPAEKQPGIKAMRGIGGALRDTHACTVSILPIPAPGEVVDGWDCGDAITTDGWTGEQVLAFFGRAQPLPATDAKAAAAAQAGEPAPEKKRESPVETGASDDAFSDYLDWLCAKLGTKDKALGRHELQPNRSLLIKALRSAEGLSTCLAFDDLRNAPCARESWPWRRQAGPLSDTDDLRLGDWLVQTYHLRAASRAALSEAIDTVADERHFHPVRDWLRGLQHDGKPRLDKWLIHVLGMDPETLAPKQAKYLQLVGRFMLMGLVARVMKPGIKFDYSPVLEGKAGMGKSTFVKELVGEDYFSDTHFDIGNGKDGMEQLEGLWAYELSELTAFKRADSEQIKQFFSSTVDRFRGAYGKYVQPHPRQCIIFCTTNKRQYLYDLTGNRRFWPVWIDQPIKLEWLRKYREQLFAEALAAFDAGERYFPTREEEEAYFYPEQEKRLVETSVQSRLYELLTREGAPGGEGKLSNEINLHTKFVTLHLLVQALGTDPGKATSLLEGQIRGWLESVGWSAHRESTGARRRGYSQPAVWPPVISEETAIDAPPAQAGASQEISDDEPF